MTRDYAPKHYRRSRFRRALIWLACWLGDRGDDLARRADRWIVGLMR